MSDFILTEDNYYSLESNQNYCSVSQFKSFYGLDGCEAKAMAKISGEYKEESSPALTIGSYVDTLLTEPSKIDTFIAEHPEMISSSGATKGLLKAEYRRANQMVERVKKDKKMMMYLSGEHQRIMTGNLFGLDFKIKMDSYLPHKAIVDLKTVESLSKVYYHPVYGRCTFVDYYDYCLQGAIYQEIVFQNTGERLPFFLACVSKEAIPDIAILYIDNETMQGRLYGNELSNGIAEQVNQIRLLKSEEVLPKECGKCDYCLPRKTIKKPIHYLELMGELS